MRFPAAQPRPAVASVVTPINRPAPVLGWNARDPIVAMPPGYAVRLDDWFPQESTCAVREGVTQHAHSFSNPVCTLMTWRANAAGTAPKLFAVTLDGIYDVSAGGNAGTVDETGVTFAYWQHQLITTAGGTFLMAVNGTDDLKTYNGSAWSTTASYSIDGGGTLNSDTIIHLNTFKRRMFFVVKDSLTFYYLPIDSIAGNVKAFSLGAVFTKGGYIMAMGTWTLDGGNGIDDIAVFYSSEGQVAVFQGTDPSDSSAWSLVGTWDASKPLGRRCMCRAGSDLYLLGENGVYAVSSIIKVQGVQPVPSITDLISGAHKEAVELYGGNLGWQLFVNSKRGALIVNVPQAEEGTAVQHIRNTTTGAWCRFTRWDSICWEEFDGDLYYGDASRVGKAWSGTLDFQRTLVATAQTAFDYLEPRSMNKQIDLFRVVLQSNGGQYTTQYGITSDFSDAVPFNPSLPPTQGGALWDSAIWDEAVWGGSATVTQGWETAAVWPGFCFSVHVKAYLRSGTLTWAAIDWLATPTMPGAL